GRLPFQGPDLDGQVILEQCEAAPGDLVAVRITGALDYDLVATPENGQGAPKTR
ncbi:MAG: 30S ribosomal protein S12 methylthiotransferase RimO, partial [Nitrospinae bacterium]|nr:30S ribosomal protein S12 methylthiotransferase RimO [Nitrospinota bacterium]